MVDDLVHEKAVVGDDHYAALEFPQVLFQDVQGENIEVVGGFVEQQEVGVLHEHGAEVKTALFPAAQFFHIVVLHGRGKEKAGQHLLGGGLGAVGKADDLADFVDGVDHLVAGIELDSRLAVMAKADGLAHRDSSRIRLRHSGNQIQKSRFSGSVIADDAHLFVPAEGIGEVIDQPDFPVTLGEVFNFHDLLPQTWLSGCSGPPFYHQSVPVLSPGVLRRR